jgi:AcrR family transcriptional regulator
MSSVLTRHQPRRAKSQTRLQDLLAAARQVFSNHGYQGATMAMVAQAAGVSEATVFTYFPGKRELCIQVIKDWYDEITQALEDALPQHHGTLERLAHVIRAHLVTLLADGSGMCALVLSEGRTAALNEPDLAQVLTDCKRRYTAPLMRCLADAQATGEIRQDMPLSLLRDLIYGAMEHVLWDAMSKSRRPAIDTTATQLTALIWSALMPPDADKNRLQRFHDEVVAALRHAQAPR